MEASEEDELLLIAAIGSVAGGGVLPQEIRKSGRRERTMRERVGRIMV